MRFLNVLHANQNRTIYDEIPTRKSAIKRSHFIKKAVRENIIDIFSDKGSKFYSTSKTFISVLFLANV